jgi:hypothetical protein
LRIVLAVLKDSLFQKTSTKRFIVLAVLKDILFHTTSTKRFWYNLSLRTASTMHNEPLGGCCLEQPVLENCKYNAQ